MKIIQITDTHLMPRGTELHGLNPCERLEACIASIKEIHADAELCIKRRFEKTILFYYHPDLRCMFSNNRR